MRFAALLLVIVLSPQSKSDELVIATFNQGLTAEASGKPLEPFSDKDEARQSKTRLSMESIEDGKEGKALRIAFDVPENVPLGYQYAGVAIPMDRKGVERYAALAFYVRIHEKELPDLYLGLKNADNDRDELAIADYIGLVKPETWARVSIPLTDFQKMRDAASLDRLEAISFFVKSGKGKVDLDDVRAVGARASSGESPARVRTEWKRGHAVWCYHDAETNIKAIRTHNASAPEGCKIAYAFVWSGSLAFNEPEKLHFDSESALMYAEKLGTECEIFPMLDASSEGLQGLGDKGLEELARQTAKAVEGAAFKGLHLDIEPYRDRVLDFCAMLRRYTKKPITISVAGTSRRMFRTVDAVAYMMYDLGSDPASYEREAAENLAKCMKDARAADGRIFVGVPAIATHTEYESRIHKARQDRQETKFRMEDYVKAALAAIRKETQPKETAFVGLGIWGLLGGRDLGGRDDEWTYQPGRIGDSIWVLLRRPPESADKDSGK